MATTSPAHAAVQPHVLATGDTLDPIKLHMQVLNSLSRCKATLTAREPMYLFAQQLLAEAQQAIATLQSIDLGREG